MFSTIPCEAFVNYAKMWIDGPAGGMYWKHAMGRIESQDFIRWTNAELVLTPDDQDPSSSEFHTTPVFYYGSRYFCLNQILNRSIGGGVIDIELMVSRDGYDWERPFRKEFFLPRGQIGQFDSGSIFTNSRPWSWRTRYGFTTVGTRAERRAVTTRTCRAESALRPFRSIGLPASDRYP